MGQKSKFDVQIIEFAAKKIAILNHPDRINMIKLLEEYDRLYVTQIYEKLNLQQVETSQHLSLLRKYGILNKVRQGKMSVYSLNKEVLEKIIKICEELSKS